jgi:hypothetical protein
MSDQGSGTPMLRSIVSALNTPAAGSRTCRQQQKQQQQHQQQTHCFVNTRHCAIAEE